MTTTDMSFQPHRGFSHFGWSTPDRAVTERFFVDVLAFPVVKRVGVSLTDGGTMQTDFFDLGDNQLIEICELRGFDGFADDFDPGLNDLFDIPAAVYHFAFAVGSMAALERRRQNLIDHGIAVSEIVDEGWRSMFFFKDPTGTTLAFECSGDDLDELLDGVPQKVALDGGLADAADGVTS